MSFTPPNIFPPSYDWLEAQDPALVTEAQFYAALQDRIQHGINQGLDPASFMDPAIYFKPGDLQLYDTIRKAWSVVPKGRICPSLGQMQMAIQFVGEPRTFRQDIELQYTAFRRWCVEAGMDPDNLNETSEERNRRLSRERMRRKRAKDAEADIRDPDEMALVRLLRAAKENAKAGHAWFRNIEKEAKQAYDAAVDAAKLARARTVSEHRQHVINADKAVADAEQALSDYRINK